MTVEPSSPPLSDQRRTEAPPPPSRAPGVVATLARAHRGPVLLLNAGFLLAAITTYLTTALMPSAVAEIGGQELYAWATTGYVVASVAAAVLVNQTLVRLGPTRSYLLAFALFTIGAVISMAAWSMPALLVGRAVAGLGGGLLSGLGYGMIRRVLPDRLWGPGTALISATFGVGTLTGPVLGGLFAQVGAWRWAFGAVALAGVLLALAARPVLRRFTASGAPRGTIEPVPVLAVVLLAGAAAALSAASVSTGWWLAGLLALAPLLIAIFVLTDGRSRSSILPRSFHARGSAMRWLLLTTALVTVVVVSEAFAPLFGQELAGLEPLVAGLLGASVSLGWSFVGLGSARVSSTRGRAVLVILGPMLATLSLAGLAATQTVGGPGGVVVWAVLLVAAGAGIGLAFPQLSVAAMHSGVDDHDTGKAAAAIPLVGMIGQSLASALAGLGMNLALPAMADAARNVYLVLMVFALIGVLTAVQAVRRGAASSH